MLVTNSSFAPLHYEPMEKRHGDKQLVNISFLGGNAGLEDVTWTYDHSVAPWYLPLSMDPGQLQGDRAGT